LATKIVTGQPGHTRAVKPKRQNVKRGGKQGTEKLNKSEGETLSRQKMTLGRGLAEPARPGWGRTKLKKKKGVETNREENRLQQRPQGERRGAGQKKKTSRRGRPAAAHRAVKRTESKFQRGKPPSEVVQGGSAREPGTRPRRKRQRPTAQGGKGKQNNRNQTQKNRGNVTKRVASQGHTR